MNKKTQKNITLTQEQEAAVLMTFRNRLSVLHGGPGTGKTTTLKQILSMAAEKKMSVLQCAPTGKAAKRMMETTRFPASTIHSALKLGFNSDGHAEIRSVNNDTDTGDPDNMVTADLLVIDETSMVSNDLMSVVLRSVDTGKTTVLLVGDPEQLPSVGAGAVLRDIIDSNCVPNTELTEIQRNAGRIVRACHAIRRGDVFEYSQKVNLNQGENFRHIEAVTPQIATDTIRMILTDYLPKNGFDPVWETQVITTTNEKGQLSCKNLNIFLQGLLNPEKNATATATATWKDDGAIRFRVNDKVIWTRNFSVKSTSGETVYIVNGDMGVVADADKKTGSVVVIFQNPDRMVRLQKSAQIYLKHAYAITCHRFQGSESPVVIIPIHSSNSFLIDRCWLYTAVSRASVLCFTVGQFEVVSRAVKRVQSYNRLTLLKDKIRKECQQQAI